MSKARLKQEPTSILSAADTNGFGNVIEVSDYRNIVITFATSGSATGTVKIAGSCVGERDQIDFATSASPTNTWDYIGAYNLNNPTNVIPGSTGIAYSGTDAVHQIIVNVDQVNFITVEVSGYMQGDFYATLVASSNL